MGRMHCTQCLQYDSVDISHFQKVSSNLHHFPVQFMFVKTSYNILPCIFSEPILVRVLERLGAILPCLLSHMQTSIKIDYFLSFYLQTTFSVILHRRSTSLCHTQLTLVAMHNYQLPCVFCS